MYLVIKEMNERYEEGQIKNFVKNFEEIIALWYWNINKMKYK